MNKIQKRFYKIFDIPKIQLSYPDNIEPFYPEIDEEIYMELLLIVLKYWRSEYSIFQKTRAGVHQEILSDICYLVDGLMDTPEKRLIKKKVLEIFERYV